MNRKLIIAATLSLTALAATGNRPALAQTPQAAATLSLNVARVLVVRFDAEEEYNKGVDFQNKGQYKEAVVAYSRAITLKPKFTDAFLNRGICYQSLGELDKAISDFTIVVTNKPKMADGWMSRGNAYVEQKKFDPAISDYNQALVVKPGMPDVYPNLAVAYYSKGDFDNAIKNFTTYVSATGSKADPNIYLGLGRAKMEKYKTAKDATLVTSAMGDFDKYIAAPAVTGQDHTGGYLDRGDANMVTKAYDKAITDYTQYLTKSPKDTYALSSRAQAYFETKKYPQAIADYDAVLALKPNDAVATQNKALAQLKTGDKTGATVTLSKGISNPPKPSEKVALELRAQAFVDSKDYPNAIKDYDYLIGFDKSNANAYYNRGVALSNTNAYDKAAADFQTYIGLGPKDPAPAYNGLGLAYSNLKQYDKAVDAFTKYLAVNPTDMQAVFNRGVAYYNSKKYKECVADMQAYLAKKPGDPQANKIMGDAASYLSPDEGLKILKVAADADPKNGDAQLNYGVGLQKVGKTDEAIAAFSKAIALNPKDTLALYNRAVAYQAKKPTPDWAAVIKDTSSALAAKPDYADALIARADANLQTKAYPAAIADYKQYLTLKPKDSYALNNLAVASLNNKDYTGAVTAFTNYLSVADEKEKPNALRARGIVYLQMDKYDEGIKDLTDYLSKTPGDAQGLYNRGIAYAKKKDFDKAASDFEASYTSKADYFTATQGAIAYTSLGNNFKDADGEKAAGYYDKAAGMYDKAVSAAAATVGKPDGPKPKDVADSYFNKGFVYELKSKAKDNDVEPLKGAVEAYGQYVQKASLITPAPTDISQVKAKITELQDKIKNG